MKKNNQDDRTIKKFKFNKKQQALVHPFAETKIESNYTGTGMKVYLITIGHLWIYRLIEKHGYSRFLNKLILFSQENKHSLLEWEIDDELKKGIQDLLSEEEITLEFYINDELNIFDYEDIIKDSKSKEHSFHRLTRLLILSKVDVLIDDLKYIDLNTDLKDFLIEKGSLINAIYLQLEFMNNNIIEIPDVLINIINKNMHCIPKNNSMKYYPKVDVLSYKVKSLIIFLSEDWYLVEEEEQVIISKFIYSLKILEELVHGLLAMNGIISTFVTRTLFDNFWQTKYLIENNEVLKYREFALDRMRLHILKRTDRTDITDIDDLIVEIGGGLIDPIPIHGDYFTKSAREYSIKLGIKDEYDKYYEYNSEFIHASLTAVYSGLMAECKNPEHNNHLTINPESSNYIDSMKHIFEIINMHIKLINTYLKSELIETFNFEESFFKDREEFRKRMNELTSSDSTMQK